MSNLDYIKSYLVKLGVDVDSSEIAKWESGLKRMDTGFKSTAKNLSLSFSKISGVYGSLALMISKFASSVAESDMQLQKFAKRMYMSRDSAKALQTTLDSMGLDGVEDLQDVALSPELTQQYKELISLSKSLGTPDGVKQSLKDIRAISFEFSKLRTTATYFFERVAHFIYQTVRVPAQKFRSFLNEFNNKFSKNINSWAKSLGTLLGNIVRLAIRLGEGLVGIVSSLDKVWSRLSGISKALISAVAAIGIAIKASPVWRMITVFTGFLMLLDDYKTFKEGGISANVLKPIWKSVENQRSDPNSGWNFLVNSIKNLVDSINKLVQMFKDFILKISNSTLGKMLGLSEEGFGHSAFIGDNPVERITNQQSYIRDVSFWDRFLADVSGGRLGISQKSYLEGLNNQEVPLKEIGPWSNDSEVNQSEIKWDNPNRLQNVTELTSKPAPEPNNMTPLVTNNNSVSTTPVNQTFYFQVSGVKDPNQFMNEVSTLIRNNKGRLVG